MPTQRTEAVSPARRHGPLHLEIADVARHDAGPVEIVSAGLAAGQQAPLYGARMKLKLVMAPLALAMGSLGFAATASPASAATCTWQDYAYVDSGVSSATVDLYKCTDGWSTWFTAKGRLWDDHCGDCRRAYLDLHAEGQGGATHSVNCGSIPYASSWPAPVYGVKARTRACNLTCSSQDDEWLYPSSPW